VSFAYFVVRLDLVCVLCRSENSDGQILQSEAVMPDQSLAEVFVAAATDMLRKGWHKIEHCVAQLDDEQIWWRPRPEISPQMNSIANLMLHLSGNMRQWIIAGVGGSKDIRNRPLSPTVRTVPKRRLSHS
jgi:hypothetical protein